MYSLLPTRGLVRSYSYPGVSSLNVGGQNQIFCWWKRICLIWDLICSETCLVHTKHLFFSCLVTKTNDFFKILEDNLLLLDIKFCSLIAQNDWKISCWSHTFSLYSFIYVKPHSHTSWSWIETIAQIVESEVTVTSTWSVSCGYSKT